MNTELENNKEYDPKKDCYEYPHNIFNYIEIRRAAYAARYYVKYEKKYTDLIEQPFTDDQLKGFTYVVSKSLTPRERLALTLRFKEKKRFSEMKDAVGLSSQRCGDIVNRACSKLLVSPRLFKFITDGYEETLSKTEYVEINGEKRIKILENDSIRDLRLSTKAKNGLLRAGFSTPKDVIVEMTEEPKCFCKIRNLGIISINEIVDALLNNKLIDMTHPFVKQVKGIKDDIPEATEPDSVKGKEISKIVIDHAKDLETLETQINTFLNDVGNNSKIVSHSISYINGEYVSSFIVTNKK